MQRVQDLEDDQVRRAARTDANQAEIIKSLRDIGCRVYYIKEPCDLLVGYRQKTVLLEVKVDGGRLTKPQVEFIAQWNGASLHVVRDPQEAVEIVVEECK
jgi:hypothetical protein